MKIGLAFLSFCFLFFSCSSDKKEVKAGSFISDVEFLTQFTPIIILSSPNGKGKIAVSPSLQGRVMTSTAEGDNGQSFGWINRELFQSRDTLLQMNAFGGEERFWLGPEGGQFGLFFKKGDPFDFDHWQTPALLDTDPFSVSSKTDTSVVFTKDAKLTNYAGFEFSFSVRREIRILPVTEKSVEGVRYQTINTITNTGSTAWKKETGLLSIWLLGMFNPTDETAVIIPFNRGTEKKLGPIVMDDYFGKVPDQRLKVVTDFIFFKADGQLRSKIGLNAKRAKNIMGSFDAKNLVLTVVEYSKPNNNDDDYVNSKWEMQREPYGGDVINSYNDGPPTPGAKPMGPFYELETSSPALELKPGESLTHTQTTRHYHSDKNQLAALAKKILGVDLSENNEFFDYFFHYDSHH